MFIAIIVPPARKVKPIAIVIGIAVVLSCILKWVPVFSALSGGWKIIICAVAASAYAAKRYPVDMDEEACEK